MLIELRHTPFEPFAEIAAYQAKHAEAGKYGATSCFIGSMRDFNDGSQVQGMTLEYYPGMTEKHLHQICERACARWAVLDALVLHRVGEITIADPIVLVAIWTAHRGDAFDACRFIMEELKSSAPFWKKEVLQDGERWVERNTCGYAN